MKKRKTLGGRVYFNDTEIRKECRRIIDSTPDETPIIGKDRDFLLDLFQHHPHAEQKTGLGIVTIYVRPTPGYKTRGLWIRRVDGSETDISFRQCIAPKTDRGDVLQAMRREIGGQIIAFRDAAFNGHATLTCPYTGETLSPNSCHIDHRDPTFETLADQWVKSEGGWSKIKLASGDGDLGSRFTSREQLGRWLRFHDQHAALRVVSVKANLSIIPAEQAGA